MFIRVDDRLIHGQVVTAWIKYININKILVVDDFAASNTMIAKALKMATPRHIDLEVISVQEVENYLNDSYEKTMIITRTIESALLTVLGNESYEWDVNIGNIGNAPGRKKIAPTVYLDEQNESDLAKLKDLGNTVIFIQTVPGEKKIELKK